MDKVEKDELVAEYTRKTLARVMEMYGPEVNEKEEQPRIEFNGIKMKCPNCGEYMVHCHVPEFEAFTFVCKRCNIAAERPPLRPTDFGFDITQWSCGGEGGWKHFIEPGESDG